MSYTLHYHPGIQQDDLPRIPENMRRRIRKGIESRLLIDPLRFGEPLKRSLRGYRKLRVGDYRVIYRIDGERVVILKIGHRKEVYTNLSEISGRHS